MNHLSEHNSQLTNLTKLKEQCYQQYRTSNTPFSVICDISSEYPCFRTDVDDPLNLKLNRPCISLTQLGDGRIDCLTGLDERNRLQCSSLGMLGFHYQFNDSLCVPYSNLCNDLYPWMPGVNKAYDTVCFHRRKVLKNGTVSQCDGLHDVMCLNDVCVKNARCNGRIDCLHGEDEFRCISPTQSFLKYRNFKKVQFMPLRLQNYPSSTKLLQNLHPSLLVRKERNNPIPKSKSENHIKGVLGITNSKVRSIYETVRDSLPNGAITFEKDYLPFICNRGVAVKYYTGHTVCFCPPSFYGSQCEYYSDRVTVTTHLDLNNYRYKTNTIKVLTTFLFQDQIIDYYDFHADPQTQTDNNYIKQQIYFVYPRLKGFLQMKISNRSGTQLYSIRFEAFDLHLNETIEPIGVWQYPIYFDFLPSFRLSKVLRFHMTSSSFSSSVCSTNPCGKNGICQEVLNSNRTSYFCSCKSGYYGIHCSYYDAQCTNYCSSQSICKPKYRGILTENYQHPLCLCPASTFGSRCYLKNGYCQSNPCLNGGSCIATYSLTDINNYTCLCTDSFEGDHCQMPKGMVNIRLMLSSNSALKTTDVVATTILYSDYEIPSLRFMVREQQVYSGLPSSFKLIYNDKRASYAPTTAILKAYGANDHYEKPVYYLLYFYPDQKEINITVDLTSENHCLPVETLWNLIEKADQPGKLQYF